MKRFFRRFAGKQITAVTINDVVPAPLSAEQERKGREATAVIVGSLMKVERAAGDLHRELAGSVLAFMTEKKPS